LRDRIELVVKQGAARHLLEPGHDVKCRDCPFRENLWCAWHNTFLGEAMILEGMIDWEGRMSLETALKLLRDLEKEVPHLAFAVKHMDDKDFRKLITGGR